MGCRTNEWRLEGEMRGAIIILIMNYAVILHVDKAE